MDWLMILTLLLMGSLYEPKNEPTYMPPKYEQRDYFVEPVKMRVTCYLPTGNRTVSGCYPFIGGCAGRKEDIGKVAVLYDMDMKYVGCFVINDCGGASSLKNGTSIDIYRNNMADARAWIKEHSDYMMVQIIEADG